MKAIVLTRGRIATVDDEDFDRVNRHKWYAHKKRQVYYGARNVRLASGKRGTEYLHDFILGIKNVDHRDGDGLENRRQNLRSATQQQNSRGHRSKSSGKTSQYRGVRRQRGQIKWTAQIHVNRRAIYLGRFFDEKDAARAYDCAAVERFGDFAKVNFT